MTDEYEVRADDYTLEKPTREQVMGVVFDHTGDDWSDNDVGNLADAILVLFEAS